MLHETVSALTSRGHKALTAATAAVLCVLLAGCAAGPFLDRVNTLQPGMSRADVELALDMEGNCIFDNNRTACRFITWDDTACRDAFFKDDYLFSVRGCPDWEKQQRETLERLSENMQRSADRQQRAFEAQMETISGSGQQAKPPIPKSGNTCPLGYYARGDYCYPW